MVLYCFKCKQEVVFDAEHIGKNGRKIPLDPTSRRPHDCPERDKQFNPQIDTLSGDKNDHGNESFTFDEAANAISEGMREKKAGYVDHTLKGQSKVKIFFGTPLDVEIDYNNFLAANKIKTQGAQFSLADNGFAIALYYEEVKV